MVAVLPLWAIRSKIPVGMDDVDGLQGMDPDAASPIQNEEETGEWRSPERRLGNDGQGNNSENAIPPIEKEN